MAVRDDEIVEIPAKDPVDAPPDRRLVPNAELDVQRGTAVLAPNARMRLTPRQINGSLAASCFWVKSVMMSVLEGLCSNSISSRTACPSIPQ